MRSRGRVSLAKRCDFIIRSFYCNTFPDRVTLRENHVARQLSRFTETAVFPLHSSVRGGASVPQLQGSKIPRYRRTIEVRNDRFPSPDASSTFSPFREKRARW